MIKSIFQSVVAAFAVTVLALGWPIWLASAAMITVAVLAAFETKRWLSAFEVFFASLTIAVSTIWWLGLILAGLLCIWNISQWMAPLKAKLIDAN